MAEYHWGNSNDYLASVIQTTDGGYLVGGSSDSGISVDKTEVSEGIYDYCVVKLFDEDFTVLPDIDNYGALVSPNPILDLATLKYDLPKGEIISLYLTDLTGKTIHTFFSENRSEGKHNEELNLQGIAGGPNFLWLATSRNFNVVKIIKQ